MDWKEKALEILKDSLTPIPSELNELDWKSALSSKTERLAQHISAFSNNSGGGILVFGVNNDATFSDLNREEIENIIKLLGNIAQNNLDHPIYLDHAVLEYEGTPLLFIHIPEECEKPVYLRGKDIYYSYHRSAGQTVRMSRSQVRSLIAASGGLSYEEQNAKAGLCPSEVLKYLDYTTFFELLHKTLPSSETGIIECLKEYNLCREERSQWSITRLGAILFAKDFNDFDSMKSREVIVRKYVGSHNREQEFERPVFEGYAIGFEKLVDFLLTHSGATEDIRVLRGSKYTYPRIAIREFLANALVHQDFSMNGMPVTIEIFSNRLSITNAGAPLNDINRLIDLPPHSRNEQLAQMMFYLGICERRGSGIDRAIAAIEEMNLPPVRFSKSEQHTRVTLFPQKCFKDMTKKEKILACYQHACLKYEEGESINNQSIRERFELSKNDSSVASRIIADTLDTGRIKPEDTETKSKKYMRYIPYYG